MDIKKACEKAEEIAKLHNPEGISPFPFDRIVKEEKGLNGIFYIELPEEVSGAIVCDKEDESFSIYVNKGKPFNRNHFTVAHELGHYFLHNELVKKEETIIDNADGLGGNSTLYRLDDGTSTEMEREANNFAASLIMPFGLVTKAWRDIGNVEECAKIFNVSVSAMSIRLERLNLIK